MLIEFLRTAAMIVNEGETSTFQILINTHSPKIMASLNNNEIVAADSVIGINVSSKTRSTRTRMRTNVKDVGDMLNPEKCLTRIEVENFFRKRLMQHDLYQLCCLL